MDGKRFLVAMVMAFGGCSGAGSQAHSPTGVGGNNNAPPDLGGGNVNSGGGGDLANTVLPPGVDLASNGTLTLIIRDFKLYSATDATTDPDFENVPKTDASGNPNTTYLGPWPDPNVVTDTLGSDNTPVYKNTGGTSLTTHGAAAFADWYHDVAGTNIRVLFPIMLSPQPDGTQGYDSNVSGVPFAPGSATKMFFPIDDGSPYATSFGDEGDAHNYSFTAEAHTTFTYNGGETFHYRGDDDVFVYINKSLVINLGGIHDPEIGDVSLDTLGLTKGMTYPLDFFFAERHKGGSNVLFTTTLALTQVPIS